MTTQAAVAVAVSFFALGATLFATIVLLLFAPRNRDARAMAVFGFAIGGWLAGEGFGALFPDRLWQAVSLVCITILPALFIILSAGDGAGRMARVAARTAVPVAVVLAVAGAEQLGNVLAERMSSPVMTMWQIGGWTLGSAMMVRDTRSRLSKSGQPASARQLMYGLAIAAPLSIAIAILFDSDAFFVYGLPLLIVGVYFALFVGIARLRFYDIEIRVARSGEIAASTAEMTRLAALGEMAASFAHEVRNPLTGVRSLAQRLAEEPIDESKRQRYASVILEEANRIEHIVENMLGMARRGPPALPVSPTPLDALLEDIVLLTATRARRAGIHLEADGGGLTIAASRDALTQALLNLTLNAVAHSPAGGRVRILARRAGAAVAIHVCDEGAGVPVSERERIFEPFYSSRPDGTGLGLSVVRTLAREAGWQVEIDDREGGGAVFRLLVPDMPLDGTRNRAAAGVAE